MWRVEIIIFQTSHVKWKPDLKGVGPFHCLFFRLNLIMYYRLPSIIITIVRLYAKPPCVLGTKTLGGSFGDCWSAVQWKQLCPYLCVQQVSIRCRLCVEPLSSPAGGSVWMSWSPFSIRARKRSCMSSHALINLCSQHSLPVLSVPVPVLGKQRWTESQPPRVPLLAGGGL